MAVYGENRQTFEVVKSPGNEIQTDRPATDPTRRLHTGSVPVTDKSLCFTAQCYAERGIATKIKW